MGLEDIMEQKEEVSTTVDEINEILNSKLKKKKTSSRQTELTERNIRTDYEMQHATRHQGGSLYLADDVNLVKVF